MFNIGLITKQFAPFLTALVISLVVTPIAIAISKRIGFSDHPDGLRKSQVQPTALGGGLVILFSASLVTVLAILPGLVAIEAELLVKLRSLAMASIVIVAVGIWDDAIGLRGRHKLLGQFIATLILVIGGFRFQGFELFAVVFDFGHLGWLVSIVWLLGAINAINLIDGADGVATTLGVGVFSSLSLVAFASSGYATALLPMIVTGTLLGFLAYNFPPARIYLGDSGSMLIGMLAGSVAIQSSLKSQATFAIAVPIALLAVPFVDTAFAILRRKMTGRSIYDTDRGHFHHCLLHAGFSPRQLVGVVAGLSAITSLLAIGNVFIRLDVISLLAIAIVVGLAVRWGIFGSGEWRLLASRMTLTKASNDVSEGATCTHIQGTRDWQVVWAPIEEFVEANDLKAARFTLNIPWLHESFHARWGDMGLIGSNQFWQIRLPVLLDGKYVGWIEAVGQGTEACSDQVTAFVELARQTEEQIVDASDPPLRKRVARRAAPVLQPS